MRENRPILLVAAVSVLLGACTVDPLNACIDEKRNAAMLADPEHKMFRGDFEMAVYKYDCKVQLGKQTAPRVELPAAVNDAKRDLDARAKAGDAEAQYQLGLKLMDGLDGFPGNPEWAVGWFGKAAAQGHAKAQLALAGDFLEGTRRNFVEGYAWSLLASKQAALEPSLARLNNDYLSDYEKAMTSAERENAKRLARNWRVGQNLHEK
jgi:TPR repeat protein